MKNWIKLGRIFDPSGQAHKHPKLLTHASNPLALHIKNDNFRIFYSGRDEFDRSSVGGFDFDISNLQITKYYSEPFVTHGTPGTFYEDGVSIGDFYKNNSGTFITFMGWQTSGLHHWRGDIGRIRMLTSRELVVDSNLPILSIDKIDPISFSYPTIWTNSDGTFEMLYGSTLSWDTGDGEMLHVLNSATSNDGEVWEKHGLAIPFEIGVAQAFSRPTILQHMDGKLEAWFSYRAGKRDKYKIGYAYRDAGCNWTLDIESSGIGTSEAPEDWDAEMIEYPFVFSHQERDFMIYNGNSNGRTGIGLAYRERNLAP